jgi:hypothetical protein
MHMMPRYRAQQPDAADHAAELVDLSAAKVDHQIDAAGGAHQAERAARGLVGQI